ncbi:MAG: DMT family transporter [Lysobacterales bacterium]
MSGTKSKDLPLKGIFFMCLAVALISGQEAMAKYLGQSLPMLQVIGARYFGHLLLMIVVLMPRNGLSLFKAKRPLVQIGRSALLLIDTALFFFSLTMIGLAEATAIFFCVPILVVLLSVPLLGERLEWSRLVAVAVGFVGMLVIIRPGSGAIGIGALLTFGAAFCVSLFNIITRKLADEDPVPVTMFYTALAGAVVMMVIVPFIWESPVGWQQWTALVLIGIAGGAAHSCIIASHVFAPASTVAPFMYSQIFWALGFGYLFFGALPDQFTVLGGAIVIASGVYLLRRYRTETDIAV